jgi:SET domain-containing protein 6
MMCEALKENSKWSPYFAILPQQLDSLVFWSDAELKELQASSVVTKVGKGKAEEMFSQHIAPLGLENYSVDLSHRIASIIMSYAFDIPEDNNPENPNATGNGLALGGDGDDLISDDGEDEKTILSMIPLADMLNADADRNNARLCCDNADLEMRTIKPIARGEEVFNDYGQLPRSDLLRRYGYVTERYAVYDVAELSTESVLATFSNSGTLHITPNQPLLSLSKEDIQHRVDLAEREGIFEDSYDLVYAGEDGPSISGMLLLEKHQRVSKLDRCYDSAVCKAILTWLPIDDLLALIYLLLLDDESLAAILNSESSLPSRSHLATVLVGQVLVVLLRAREQEYGTSLEEDEKLLLLGSLPNRAAMAIQVRLGEKKVLRAAMQEASSFSGSNRRMRYQTSEQDNFRKKKRGMGESSGSSKKGRFR